MPGGQEPPKKRARSRAAAAAAAPPPEEPPQPAPAPAASSAAAGVTAASASVWPTEPQAAYGAVLQLYARGGPGPEEDEDAMMGTLWGCLEHESKEEEETGAEGKKRWQQQLRGLSAVLHSHPALLQRMLLWQLRQHLVLPDASTPHTRRTGMLLNYCWPVSNNDEDDATSGGGISLQPAMQAAADLLASTLTTTSSNGKGKAGVVVLLSKGLFLELVSLVEEASKIRLKGREYHWHEDAAGAITSSSVRGLMRLLLQAAKTDGEGQGGHLLLAAYHTFCAFPPHTPPSEHAKVVALLWRGGVLSPQVKARLLLQQGGGGGAGRKKDRWSAEDVASLADATLLAPPPVHSPRFSLCLASSPVAMGALREWRQQQQGEQEEELRALVKQVRARGLEVTRELAVAAYQGSFFFHPRLSVSRHVPAMVLMYLALHHHEPPVPASYLGSGNDASSLLQTKLLAAILDEDDKVMDIRIPRRDDDEEEDEDEQQQEESSKREARSPLRGCGVGVLQELLMALVQPRGMYGGRERDPLDCLARIVKHLARAQQGLLLQQQQPPPPSTGAGSSSMTAAAAGGGGGGASSLGKRKLTGEGGGGNSRASPLPLSSSCSTSKYFRDVSLCQRVVDFCLTLCGEVQDLIRVQRATRGIRRNHPHRPNPNNKEEEKEEDRRLASAVGRALDVLLTICSVSPVLPREWMDTTLRGLLRFHQAPVMTEGEDHEACLPDECPFALPQRLLQRFQRLSERMHGFYNLLDDNKNKQQQQAGGKAASGGKRQPAASSSSKAASSSTTRSHSSTAQQQEEEEEEKGGKECCVCYEGGAVTVSCGRRPSPCLASLCPECLWKKLFGQDEAQCYSCVLCRDADSNLSIYDDTTPPAHSHGDQQHDDDDDDNVTIEEDDDEGDDGDDDDDGDGVLDGDRLLRLLAGNPNHVEGGGGPPPALLHHLLPPPPPFRFGNVAPPPPEFLRRFLATLPPPSVLLRQLQQHQQQHQQPPPASPPTAGAAVGGGGGGGRASAASARRAAPSSARNGGSSSSSSRPPRAGQAAAAATGGGGRNTTRASSARRRTTTTTAAPAPGGGGARASRGASSSSHHHNSNHMEEDEGEAIEMAFHVPMPLLPPGMRFIPFNPPPPPHHHHHHHHHHPNNDEEDEEEAE